MWKSDKGIPYQDLKETYLVEPQSVGGLAWSKLIWLLLSKEVKNQIVSECHPWQVGHQENLPITTAKPLGICIKKRLHLRSVCYNQMDWDCVVC